MSMRLIIAALPFSGAGQFSGRIPQVGNLHSVALGFVVGVGNSKRQIEEKWRLGVPGDEIQGLLREQVVRIDDPFCRHPTTKFASGHGGNHVGQRHFALVAPKEVGVVVVGVYLIQIAEEGIEAFLVGNAAGPRPRPTPTCR